MRLRMSCICFLSLVVAQSTSGFTNDTLIVVSRFYTADTIASGDTLGINFRIENNESYNLSGFFLSDQIPSEFTILYSKVQISGTDLDDYSYEVGYSGEIYDGNTPHRWIFETPPVFGEVNPVPPGEVAEIEYLLGCPEAGTYVFRNFSWAGAVVRESDTLWVFGYDDDSLQIVVIGSNRPPVLSSIGAKTVAEGDTLSFTVTASDPDLDPLVLSASPLPPNAYFTDNGDGTGDFLFTPDSTQAGSYDLLFVASDGVLADSELVRITVTEVGVEEFINDRTLRNPFLHISPNPFTVTTTIAYLLPTEALVNIRVYNSDGRLVRQFRQEKQAPGYHQVEWMKGALPSGIYFLYLEAGQHVFSKKVILMK